MPDNTDAKKRILILTSTFPRWKQDNVTTFVQDYAKHLKENGCEPLVLAPHYQGAKKREVWDGVPVRRFRYWFREAGQDIVYNGGGLANLKKNPIYVLKVACYAAAMFVATVRLTFQYKIAILNPHWLVPQGFIATLAKFLTRSSVLITIHGSDVFALNSKVMRCIKRWILRQADEVVVNSTATKNATSSLFAGHTYHVIPMGVDTALFSPQDGEPVPHDALRLLFVGRLTEEKGVMYACRAINALVNDGYTDVILKIAGSGPEEERLHQYVREHHLEQFIELLGWVDPAQLPELYGASDLFVGPSVVTETGKQEAFGLVFAESLATGTPVIGTATGGIADVVIDGENGFLVPDKDPTAIADKIKYVYDDQDVLERLRVNAREHIVKNFSWEATTQKYLNVIGELS